ncbi:MAG: tRNA (adenine-N1)-methyltransferase [Chloroflexi bacterium]|nr:tRNA (adenine-N1)-methyltransferase [Chloroflexota bacterium]
MSQEQTERPPRDNSQAAEAGRETQRGPFQAGERVLLVDDKGRRKTLRLRPGQAQEWHVGHLEHDRLIGQPEGTVLTTPQGRAVLVLRQTLADFVQSMARASQIIYPKDLAAILMDADIYPGARAFESGVGSGALTLALLRGVGPTGNVVSYEVREDMLRRARENIRDFLGAWPENLALHQRDAYEGIQEAEVDRVVLDLPEPWRMVEHAAAALRSGGIFLAYLPTVLQVHHLTQALMDSGQFHLAETHEVLVRPWHVGSRSVRPDHRMVAHTGFITTARRGAGAKGTHFPRERGVKE